MQEQRDNIAITKKNNELEKKQQKNFNDNYLEKLNLEIQNLTLKHKLSRKKLSDAAGESGEFSKQSIKLNNELENIKSLIQPLESSKRNFEEEIIQINIQRDEISNQIDVLKLEKQKLSEFNQNNEKSTDTKNRNLSSIRLSLIHI